MNKTKIKNQTHDEDDGDVIGFEGKGLRKIWIYSQLIIEWLLSIHSGVVLSRESYFYDTNSHTIRNEYNASGGEKIGTLVPSLR